MIVVSILILKQKRMPIKAPCLPVRIKQRTESTLHAGASHLICIL